MIEKIKSNCSVQQNFNNEKSKAKNSYFRFLKKLTRNSNYNHLIHLTNKNSMADKLFIAEICPPS